jgi:predicted transcriptional regulator
MRFKKRTEGPESILVNDFLSAYKQNNSEIGNYFIFMEPFTESGFPDIVIVLLDDAKIIKWHPERSNLSNLDLKILHHMMTERCNFTIENLKNQLGYSTNKLQKSLDKLTSVNLVRNFKNNTYRVCAINEAFYVKSIIAIEAKIKNWKDAFAQAETNLWFASESYVLFRDKSINHNIINKASLSPAGLLSLNNSKYQVISKSEKRKMPVSYFSWIINEYIVKKTFVDNGIKHGSIEIS